MTGRDGPSLETYIETRLNLVREDEIRLRAQIKEELRLITLEIDRHFELKRQHFTMLEKSIDERLAQTRDELFAIRREIKTHADDSAKSRDIIIAHAGERVDGVKALLSQTIAHNESAVIEAKSNLEARFVAVNEWRQTYGDLVKLNVAQDTYNEFKKAQDGRWEAISSYMSANQGERAGTMKLWAIAVAAIMAGAAVTSMFQFFSSVQRAPPQIYVAPDNGVRVAPQLAPAPR